MRMNVTIGAITVIVLAGLADVGCTPAPIYTSVRRTESSKQKKKTEKGLTITTKPVAGSVSKIDPDAMMGEIESWTGTPYAFGMVEKGKGTDCSGFVGSVFRKVLSLDLPRQSADMYAVGSSVNLEDLQFGDLIFFQNTYKGASGASHVGIFVGDGRFAHASTTVGVTISRLNDSYYQQHFLGCRRVWPERTK